MKRWNWLLGATVIVVLASACAAERNLAGADLSTTTLLASEAPVVTAAGLTVPPAATDPSGDATAVPDTPQTVAPETVTPQTVAPDTTPVLTSTVVGTAGSGSSGGIGPEQTTSLSETVRNADGTCSGWSNDSVPAPWTQGLVSGAAFVVLAADSGAEVGRGNLGTSFFEDVDPSDRQQWLCTFPFSVQIVGAVPAEMRIKVAGLKPWKLHQVGTGYVASVDTTADAGLIEACVAQVPTDITAWSVVGTYWSNGIQDLCSNGLTVAAIQRVCRQPDQASEYITKVSSAGDPETVYEDASGLVIEPSALAPGEPVRVFVTTGKPC